MSLPINTIQHGNCLEVLRNFPDASVDSIVTDVPYGLGDRDPAVAEIIAYLQGADLVTGEFMGKDWQIPSVLVWRECFRILKPGGFLLSFAGTRTLDLISIGIRAAGFENRDCIDAEMGPPVLRWVRAQGMPKSTDIAKALSKPPRKGKKAVEGPPVEDVTKQWEGFGTALKPYWEPILMFRKPVEESTVVGQVMKTGTGCINIDGCRIKHSSPEDFARHKAGVDAIKAKGGMMDNSWKNSSDLSGANDVSTAGRFPPNVIFVHSDLCHSTGSEETPIWDCHHSCPVYWLNKQSGVTVSRPDTRSDGKMDTRADGKNWRFKRKPSNISDSGGASRYFLNVDPGSLCFYVPKPSAGEKTIDEEEENEHSTVKPVRLMEYLVRLVTRKDGIVLDPYCGSGTTCVAAVNEGMNFIGIEKEAPSVKTALARTAKSLRERRERETQQAGFDLSMSLESD